MPSIPELVYAALLYKDGAAPASLESKDFVQGTATEDGKLIFSFQRPDDTSGKFTLEIFAFVKTEGGAEDDTMQFSRGAALLSGNKTGLSIVGDTIEISEAIPLSSDKPGTVSLKIKVPDECSLEIDDTANFDCKKDDLSSDTYTIVEKDGASGIATGAYQVTFTVKKDDEIVHIFSEYINVINGLCTDTWWNGEKSSEVKDVANSIAKTVYVRGTGGYYDTNSPYNQDGNAMADDEHTGSFLSPLASIQKAIDKIIAINDGTSAYTICVDGMLTATDTTYIGTNGMADFSALGENLNLTIKALPNEATLDGGARFDADGNIANAGGIRKRVIHAKPASGTLNLTLENLTITGGYQNSGYGGGIYVRSPGGELKISNGTTICRNKATRGGGGAVYVVNATFDMSGGTISNCKTTSTSSSSGGGGIYNDAGTLTISGGTISDCVAAINGGGIYNNVSDASIVSTITNCEISGCKATGTGITGCGGGIYNASGTLELTDVTITGENNIDNPDARYGGGIYSEGSLTITGGKISNCTSNIGGGVYKSAGTLKITDGTISENNASKNGGGVYVIGSGSSFTMNGGEISNNKAEDAYGGGIYIKNCTFTMSDGTISGNTASEAGGGVYMSDSDCAFTMESGTINNNTANKYSGGGVAVTNASTFTMKSGTISGNTAKLNSNDTSHGGGGVYTVYESTFIMEDGTISNNKALGGNGGGVFCWSENDKFEMKGGSISENTADGDGGGVYVNRGSAFTMSGGTISGNNASNGNGAYLAAKGKLNMSGAAQFAESDDVYLYANGSDIPTITVAGALTASSQVATITPSAYTAGRQVLSAGTDMTIDDTVCGKFAVSQKGWEIAPNDDGTAGVLGISIYLNSSSGDDANSGLTASKAVKTLTKAIELFESQSAQKIMVCAEYTLPSEESTLLDRAGKEHLTLMRYIGKSDVSGAFRGKLLTISQGNVTITNVTLDGTIIGYATDELLSISGSGTEVTLGDDAIICNNSYSGVCVSSYNGKFKMTGGAITGNRTSFGGGGVEISYGTFEMSGGIISGNSGGYGGGVDIGGAKSGCKFTMSGGEISGNRAKRGAGVNVSKGLYTGTFEMSGGTISENQSYGTGDDADGGGVYVSGKFTMSGGEITGNTATTSGGGVYVDNSGTFTMEGGKIMDNTATSKGNGVYKAENATFTHTGGTVQED
ncbi:MAG: hypothetical protein HDR52_01180 [Treponema sp.]|nr:hypothetical protein [Treponema sp.]